VIEINTFNNFGFLSADIPPQAMQEIRAAVLSMQKDFSKATPYNDNLVGHIRHEYLINELKPVLSAPLIELAYEYDAAFNYSKTIAILKKDLPFSMGDLWVNFQTKGEYNPPHIHSGIYSFAIWVSIPYTRNAEEAYMPTMRAGRSKNGSFSFSYITALGHIQEHNIPLDTSCEGKLVFFPAAMQHSVYPFFSSDDYRVSISGNIFLGES
jgi:hypothetical protein